jgi:hypothetical protein
MTKRNNFYKKEGGKQVPGTDLYRWANSGHWTNYDLAEIGVYKLPDPLLLGNGNPVKDANTWLNWPAPAVNSRPSSARTRRTPGTKALRRSSGAASIWLFGSRAAELS